VKKKLLLTTVAAAAMIFTGANFDKAEAAQVKYQPTTQVTYKVATQAEAQKLIQQYLAKYNFQAPTQWKVIKPTTQKPAEQTTTQKPAEQTTTQTTSSVSAFEKQVVELTNAERAKQGLAPLTLDTELSKVARTKSQDMKDKNYFDHNSPTYGSPFDMMKSFGVSYKSAGENIAQGQTTPEQVVQAWMDSQGHRENIMNSSFTHIGVGYVASGNYWTQMFIGK
jgi:uncharacterized YkwD family protein